MRRTRSHTATGEVVNEAIKTLSEIELLDEYHGVIEKELEKLK